MYIIIFTKWKNNDEKQQNHIVFNVFFIILINIFWCFFDYPVFAQNQQTKISTQKNDGPNMVDSNQADNGSLEDDG